MYWNECLLFITISSHYNCTHTKWKQRTNRNERSTQNEAKRSIGQRKWCISGACICTYVYIFAFFTLFFFCCIFNWLSFLFFSFQVRVYVLLGHFTSKKTSGKFKLANHGLILHEQFIRWWSVNRLKNDLLEQTKKMRIATQSSKYGQRCSNGCGCCCCCCYTTIIKKF